MKTKLVLLLAFVVSVGWSQFAQATEQKIVSSVQVADWTSTSSEALKPALGPVSVKVVYVSENQPVHLVDANGKLLQIIYLKPAR